MNYINPSPIKAAITAVGAYVPEDKLTNADLEQIVDTNDEWIVARTGISANGSSRTHHAKIAGLRHFKFLL